MARGTLDLAGHVEQLVRSRTHGLISGLRVRVRELEISVYGQSSSYYGKQLATHAVMEALDDDGQAVIGDDWHVTNAIEVQLRPPF